MPDEIGAAWSGRRSTRISRSPSLRAIRAEKGVGRPPGTVPLAKAPAMVDLVAA